MKRTRASKWAGALVAGVLASSSWLGPQVALGEGRELKKPAFEGPPIARIPEQARAHIDIVFCVDNSGSMGGVIETAKQKVWSIVNEIALAKPSPILRIGLIGYGQADRAFRQTPLTDDLDAVYKDLMAFDPHFGGSEWVGLMIHKATTEMAWSEGKQVMKVIYVVGNETARQGPEQFDYAKTAPAAIAKGIMVNAIHCSGGGGDATEAATWQEVAKLADGRYMQIAADGGAVVVATPFDQELADLNTQLNGTYVAFGARREDAKANQLAQDANAAGLSGAVLADRAAAKASGQYRNAGWDLVDASKEADFDWSKVKDEELPEEMRELNAEERKAYVEEKAKEREQIQGKIKELAAKRDEHVRAELKKKAEASGETSFDAAVRDSVREQAEAKGFVFEEK